jgi:hypothetical protein
MCLSKGLLLVVGNFIDDYFFLFVSGDRCGLLDLLGDMPSQPIMSHRLSEERQRQRTIGIV